MRGVFAGEVALPRELAERAARVWPLNPGEFYPVEDDAPLGVRLMRREESEASARVLRRGGPDYYEYRDTAMSRLASFRPEWIRPLCVVDGCDPYDGRIQWNDGHFLFQLTYFLGPVNFYFERHGRRHGRALSGGDSALILPFVPHTFASRSGEARGLILALTFGGRLYGAARDELGALGVEAARKFLTPAEDPVAARAALLRTCLANSGYSRPALARRSGIGPGRLAELLDGAGPPLEAELAALARALRVGRRELEPVLPEAEDGVTVRRGADDPAWGYPDDDAPCYRLRGMASSPLVPFARGLVAEPLADRRDETRGRLDVGLHQYGYNPGPAPVRLEWEAGGRLHAAEVRPGDSFYMKPFVPHWLSRVEAVATGADARLLLLRIPGRLTGGALAELAAVGEEGVSRVVGEDRPWYDEGGRN